MNCYLYKEEIIHDSPPPKVKHIYKAKGMDEEIPDMLWALAQKIRGEKAKLLYITAQPATGINFTEITAEVLLPRGIKMSVPAQ